MAYVVLEDIIRNQGFVDARIFVGLQMNEGLLRHALMRGFLYQDNNSSADVLQNLTEEYVLLLGAMWALGVVTGCGSTAWSVLTASKSRARILNKGSRRALRPWRQYL